MKTRYKWKSLERSNAGKPRHEATIAETMKSYSLDRDAAIKMLDDYEAACEYWINDIYQVQVRRGDQAVHLNIRRRDGGPILRDWRHFQWIKNQLVGEECEGVELYPAESRLNDTSNKFHIWCCADPTYRFPFGFEERDVRYDSGPAAGLRQRSL